MVQAMNHPFLKVKGYFLRIFKIYFKFSNNDEDKEHVGSIYLANNPHCFKIVEMRLT